MEPAEFKMLVEETERAFLSLGKVQYGIQKDEIASLRFKRSIYIVKDMKEGEVFSVDNIKIIRPGLGVSPKFFDTFIGKKINKDVVRGTALTFDLIA